MIWEGWRIAGEGNVVAEEQRVERLQDDTVEGNDSLADCVIDVEDWMLEDGCRNRAIWLS
jgi:hypothetical protein